MEAEAIITFVDDKYVCGSTCRCPWPTLYSSHYYLFFLILVGPISLTKRSRNGYRAELQRLHNEVVPLFAGVIGFFLGTGEKLSATKWCVEPFFIGSLFSASTLFPRFSFSR